MSVKFRTMWVILTMFLPLSLTGGSFPFSLSEACLQEVLGNAPDGEANGRVEFLPVEWRTSLTLDGGVLLY